MSKKPEINVNFLTVLTPTGIKELIFGGQLNGAIRNVIEPVSADEQCNRAGKSFTPGQLCWLCGCPIKVDDSKACEHIFPALRAIMFNGIITTGKISRRFDEVAVNSSLLRRVTDSNYDWAHENCNGSGAKGGMVLFEFDEISQEFVVDRNKCNELQTKIVSLKNPKREDCYTKLNKKDPRYSTIFKNMERVIQERLAPVNEEFGFFKSNVENRPDAILYYAKYTEELIKLYASHEALQLLLTEADKERIQEEKQKQEIEAERLLNQLLEQQTKSKEAYQLYLRSQQEYISRVSIMGTLDVSYLSKVVPVIFSQQKNYFRRPLNSRTHIERAKEQQIIQNIIDNFVKLQRSSFDPSVYSIGFMSEVLNVFCFVSMNHYMTGDPIKWVHADGEPWKKHLINALINFKVKCELHGKNYTDELYKISTVYGDKWYTTDINDAVMAHDAATDFATVTSDDRVGFDEDVAKQLQELSDYIETNNGSSDPEARVDAAKQEYSDIMRQYDDGDMEMGGGSRYIYKETMAKKKSCKKKRKTRRKRKSTTSLFSL
jgi:hypothetical protein